MRPGFPLIGSLPVRPGSPLTRNLPVCPRQVFSNSWQGPAGRFLDYYMCLGLSLQTIFHSLWPTRAFLRQNTKRACDLHALHPQTYRSSHAGRGYLRQQVIQHGKSPSWSTRRGTLFWWLWASHSNSKALHFLGHKMWQIKFALLIYRKTAVKRTLCPVKHSTDAGYRQDKKASACHQRSCLNVLFKIQQCPCCLVTRMSWNVLRGFLLLAFSNNFIPKHQQEQHPPRVLSLLKVSSFLTLWRSMQIVSLKLCRFCQTL